MTSKVQDDLPRVVIVGDNASMEMSGEAATTLYYFPYFMKFGVDTRVVVHGRCREELERTLSREDFERFYFTNDTKLQSFIYKFFKRAPERIRSLIGDQWIHILTGFRSRRIVKRLVEEGLVDVVFEPIPIAPKAVSCQYALGVPVVIGPMCGGLSFPPAFRYMDPPWVSFTLGITRILSQVLNRLIPGKHQATFLVVGNPRAKQALPKGLKAEVVQVIESGVELNAITPNPFPRRDPSQPARFAYFARFVDWKGIEFLVEAFPKVLERTNAVLDLIGDGDLLEATKAQAERLGISDHVVFYGRVPLARGLEIVNNADAYMATGIRECGGLTLLEALGSGTPVIAANWMAPGDYIDETSGIRVDVSSRQAFIDGLADAMVQIAENPELQKRLSVGALERSKSNYFGWEAKSKRILDILIEATGGPKFERDPL